jgi:hypothetical protein
MASGCSVNTRSGAEHRHDGETGTGGLGGRPGKASAQGEGGYTVLPTEHSHPHVMVRSKSESGTKIPASSALQVFGFEPKAFGLMFDVAEHRPSTWRTKRTGESRSRAESQANKFSPARMLFVGRIVRQTRANSAHRSPRGTGGSNPSRSANESKT